MTRLSLPSFAAAFLLTTVFAGGVARGQVTPNIQPSTDTANSMPETAQVETALVVRTVTLVGVRSISQASAQGAAERAALGRVGNRATIAAAVNAVVALYRSKRYALAQVTEGIVSSKGELRLTVAEGTIRRITVVGNTRTRTRTILAALTVKQGDTYRADRTEADRLRLARLGIFEDVKIGAQIPTEEGKPEPKKPEVKPAAETIPSAPTPYTQKPEPPKSEQAVPPVAAPPVPPPPPLAPPIGPVDDAVGQVDVIVRVRETATANVAATVGYSDGVGAVGFIDLSEDNLLGTANRVGLAVAADFAGAASTGRLHYAGQ